MGSLSEEADSVGSAERRYLTILFCDLSGFTGLGEQVEPEVLHQIRDKYQRLVLKVVERYGGFVSNFAGDGVLCYFGYPTAHENDAERAVRAALELVEQVAKLDLQVPDQPGLRLDMRAGLHTGLVLMAPDARGSTWDAIGGMLSWDVAFIDRALTSAFSRVRVDPTRVRIIGFSDGATYSLTLGIINGDLFSRIVAFSPGFVVSRTATGKPKMFITHGTSDTVLPIDQTSRVIVPALRNAGYDVEYHEFDGGHAVPADLLPEAVAWAST